MYSVKILIVVLVIGTVIQAQTTPVPEEPIFGKFETGKYQNKFFGFSINVPADWVMPPGEIVAAARTLGIDSFKTEKKEHDTRLQNAARTDISLFTIAEPSPFQTSQTALISVAAQKQSDPKISAETVMNATKSLLLASPKIRLVKDVAYQPLGGKRLPMIELSINTGPGPDIKQRLFVIIIRGYAVSIGAAFTDDQTMARVEKVLNTLKFTRK